MIKNTGYSREMLQMLTRKLQFPGRKTMKLILTIEARHDYGAQTFHAFPVIKNGRFVIDGWFGGARSDNFTADDQAFFGSVFDTNVTRALHQLNRLKLCDAFDALADGGSISLSLFTYKNNINVSAALSDANA